MSVLDTLDFKLCVFDMEVIAGTSSGQNGLSP